MNSSADKGILSLTQPGISLYTPAQRAIILWNGKKEVLILSTNVSAQEKTKVLEVLPLPLVPEIKEGEFSHFESVIVGSKIFENLSLRIRNSRAI